MIGFLYALPAVLFFVAVGMLFINLQKPKHLWLGIGIGFLGLIVLMLTLALVYLSQTDQQLLLTAVEQQAQENDNHSKQSSLLLSQLVAVKLQPSDHFDRYTQYGLSVKNAFFLQLDTIHQQLKTFIAKPGLRSKNKVSVYRLPQDSNQLLLANYLRTLGYQTYLAESSGEEDAESAETSEASEASEEEHDANTTDAKSTKAAKQEKEVKDSAATDKDHKKTTSAEAAAEEQDDFNAASETSGEEPVIDGDQVVATSTTDLNKLKSLLTFKKGSVNVSTHVVDHASHDEASDHPASPPGLDRPILPKANVMYYGSAVSDYDIKVIALALMRAGIPLRGIRTFKEGNRPYDIELDWAALYEKRPIIPTDKILSKKSFDR